jgi:transposase
VRKSTRPVTKRVPRQKKIDARKLSAEAKETLRLRAVKMVRQEVVSVVDAAQLLGVDPSSIHGWLNLYDAGGLDGLKVKKAPGRERKMTLNQEQRIFQVMRKKTPEHFGFSSMLWTRELIAKVISKLFKVTLSLPSVSRLLQRLSITFQKPIRRAYQCDPKAVKKWREETLPEIEAQASDARASLFYGDESTVRADHLSGKTWAPSGKMTGEQFCGFLDRLMRGRRRPVYLILDNSRVHHSKAVAEHVASFKGKLKIFFSQVIRHISTRTSVFGQT